MTTLQIILLIIAGALAVWQVTLLAVFTAMMASGKYKNVRVGVIPGVLCVLLLIAVVLL